MNILITGANGQLGSELHKLSGDVVTANGNSYIFTDIAELDITNINAICDFMLMHKIEVVVNCAAYTNVEKAEDDFYTANLINNEAVANLANVCKDNKAFLIHISTDYVFGGTDSNIPYGEDERPNPLGVYGKTKLNGEASVKRILDKYLIFRTAWLYSQYGNNFVKTMRKLMSEKEMLKVVFDQVGTPTNAADLATVIYKIIEEKLYKTHTGIYNFSNEGVCSWYDFAVAIGELSGTKCNIVPCYSAEFLSKVKRPAFSVLDKTKIKRDFVISIPYWRNSLARCIEML
ncbi:MAG: dTDP-4-dehydrorhamnose reductase [Bacteroidales bacterium]